MTTKKDNSLQQIATQLIAEKVLGLDTLETRKSDSLDFHELAIWQIKEALEKAFEAGARAGIGMAS